jgi:P pilus assembly chaperone PapD
MAMLLASLLAGTATAQVSVEVTPLRVELTLGGGATHTQAVTLKNDDSKPVRVRARVDDYYLSRDGTPQFRPADPADPYSAAAWVRVNPVEQTIAPDMTATVRFTTTVPAGTRDGGYRCAVMFEFDHPTADPAARARDVVFRGRVATLLYATVGKPIPAVELTDLQIRSTADRPPDVVATLKSTGRAYVRTKGSLTIIDAVSGLAVRQLAVPNVPVLPESEREVSISTAEEKQTPLPPGRYRVEIKIDLGLPAVLVGETTMDIAPPRIK